jgi:hypothetical protein
MKQVITRSNVQLFPLAPTRPAQLFCVEVHVDHPDQAVLVVHDGEGQQPVQDEELAGVQHRSVHREGDDLANHDVGDRRLQGAQQQPGGRNDAFEPAVTIDNVEVDNAALRGLLPHGSQSLAYGLADAQPDQVPAHVMGYRVIVESLPNANPHDLSPFRRAFTPSPPSAASPPLRGTAAVRWRYQTMLPAAVREQRTVAS